MATKKTPTKKSVKATGPAKSPVTTQKSAAKKAPSKKATARKAPAAKPAESTAPDRVSPEERYKMVQEAAYYLAEKQHFVVDSLEVWVEAEKQVDAMLAAKA